MYQVIALKSVAKLYYFAEKGTIKGALKKLAESTSPSQSAILSTPSSAIIISGGHFGKCVRREEKRRAEMLKERVIGTVSYLRGKLKQPLRDVAVWVEDL